MIFTAANLQHKLTRGSIAIGLWDAIDRAEREAVNNPIAALYGHLVAANVWGPFVQKLGGTWAYEIRRRALPHT
jgi:hypothetical protein